MRLYDDLAKWWPLLSPASEYEEEAEQLAAFLRRAGATEPKTVLELGCGGGSLSHWLRSDFELTLTDVSEGMLECSRLINPECEHVVGDMRTMFLDRKFDAVFVHDAIMYAQTPNELRATFVTARRHLEAGGGFVVLPDFMQEQFEAGLDSGGHDGDDGRGLRYLEWTWDPDPTDHTVEVAFAFLLREADGTTVAEQDRHRWGSFPRRVWEALLVDAGFELIEVAESSGRSVFLARAR